MKILVVNDHLDTGGISQSLLNFLHNIKYLDIDIDLQLLKYDEESQKQCKKLKNVRILKPINLVNIYFTSIHNQKNIIDKLIKLFLIFISKIIGRNNTFKIILFFVPNNGEYDIAISYANDIWTSHVNGFYGGCNDYVLKKVKSKKRIAWIHNDPDKLGLTHDICKRTYARFDTIINVSYACKKTFDQIIPEYKYKSKVVYNMFDIEKIKILSKKKNPYNIEKFNLVTVARLDNQQKRIDKIVDCCKMLKETGISHFEWHIIGDGPDKEWLIKYSNKNDVNDVLNFHGLKRNPYPYIKYANIFVLTSDYEAYGMVLTESLIVDTPVVSTNFPAASEVIGNESTGIIIKNDIGSIYNIIKEVIQNPKLIKEMTKHLEENKINNKLALQQFEKILGEY